MFLFFFFFKQKTAYEMRISDWSSDVCSSDLGPAMKVFDTRLAGVKRIEIPVFSDERGYFLESYQARRYEKLLGLTASFVQDNSSRSRRGVLRGLHYQNTHPQGKLVQVAHGERSEEHTSELQSLMRISYAV